jgi:hypothetical protein
MLLRSQVVDMLKARINKEADLKKVSTAGMQETRNISGQNLTIGLGKN